MLPTTTATKSAMATIESFLQSVGTVKQADGSTPLSEPGSIGGPTTHPVKKVDDRLESAPEGARFKENTKDVDEAIGAASVQKTTEAKAASVFDLAASLAKTAAGKECATCKKTPCTCAKMAAAKKAEGMTTPGSAEDDQIPSILKVAPTGDDPKSETASAKAGKNDPGSTHPARTDNNEIDGHKWASADASLEELVGVVKETSNALCAQIKLAYDQQPAGAAPIKTAGATVIDSELAHQVGWELAGLVNGTMDKRAADAMVQETLYNVIKEAAADADRFSAWLRGAQQKAADGPPPPMDPAAAGGAPPPGMPPGGGDEQAMMAALGGGAPGGAPPGGPGGMPPPGGDPSGGAGGGPDQETAALAQLLESLGITEEEFMQALQEQESGGGGAPPPDAGGGAPPPDSGPPIPGAAPAGKEASAKKHAAEMGAFISELVQRSRTRRK